MPKARSQTKKPLTKKTSKLLTVKSTKAAKPQKRSRTPKPLTVKSLRTWFKNHIKDRGAVYTLDKDQAAVVLDNHKNALVTARAGAGKTRTIVAKIAFLIAHEKVAPSEIIVFAFNRKAAAEINARLKTITFDGAPIINSDAKIATTFHSFAYRILRAKSSADEDAKPAPEDVVKNATESNSKTTPQKIEIADESRSNRYFEQLLTLALTKTDSKTGAPLPPDPRELARATNHLSQFIARSEQLFFDDYDLLSRKIATTRTASTRTILSRNFEILTHYHAKLNENGLYNYNQLLTLASHALEKSAVRTSKTTRTLEKSAASKLATQYTAPKTAKSPKSTKTPNTTKAAHPYRYIFIDEYQDFSLLFLTLTRALRSTCPDSHLLAVGDDWQAINRFAGSDVKYFKHFEKYFSEDSVKLFIPTNYRSGKKIVKNANHFMGNSLKDFNGCRAANRLNSHISILDVRRAPISELSRSNIPLGVRRLLHFTTNIITSNPEKSIKVLHRNNDLSFKNWSLARFMTEVNRELKRKNCDAKDLSFSTIHKSKGLEADVIIMLEVDVDKFPAPDHDGDLYSIFGETPETRLTDSYLLFYVAITRAKEKLFILTSTPPDPSAPKADRRRNLLSFLNPNLLS